jgi:signal transduction histidine kinase
MRRVTLLLLLFGALVLVPAGVLLVYGHRYLGSEEARLRRETYDERARALASVRAALSDTLCRIETAEAGRPWYHYRHRFVPPDLLSNTVALDQSPLYPLPQDPLVRAHFEWDPQRPRLGTPAEGAADEPDPAEAAAARGQLERVRLLRPSLEPVLGALLAARAEAFPVLILEDVTSEFLLRSYADHAQAVGEVAAAQGGDEDATRRLAEQWGRHQEVQNRARRAYKEELRNQAPAAQQQQLVTPQTYGAPPPQRAHVQAAQPSSGPGGPGAPPTGDAQPDRADATGRPGDATGAQRDGAAPPVRYAQAACARLAVPPAQMAGNAANLQLAQQVKARNPGTAAIEVRALTWAWVGDGAAAALGGGEASSGAAAASGVSPRTSRPVEAAAVAGGEPPTGALVGVRLVDLDGTTLVQGFELDLPALLARLDAIIDRLGLAGHLRLAPASDPREVVDISFLRPAEDHVEALLAPSRWLLYGSGGLIAGLLTLGLLALRRIVRGHLELARKRTDFVAAVSHELKAPLTAIRAMAELLASGIVTGEDKQREYFGHIQAESERLSRLIGNVLDLSRLERNRRAYELASGDVGVVLRELAASFRPHLVAHGFSFEVDVADDLPAARFDRDALSQVVANLLDNAAKYTAPCETKRIALRAGTASAEDGAPTIVIEVEDTGPGIPRQDRERVFERFTRGSEPLARGTGGAGLGLAIALEHVTGHGGRIEVESGRGGGATLRVVLPADAHGTSVRP